MIRGVAILTGLVLGLVMAAAVELRMAHLRRIVPEELPNWSEAVSDEARFVQGELSVSAASIADLAFSGDGSLSWELTWPDFRGPAWKLLVVAPGIRLEGRVVLPLSGLVNRQTVVSVTRLHGRIETSALLWADRLGHTLPDGILELSLGRAIFTPHEGILSIVEASGQVYAARFNDQAFGEGPFDLRMAPDGGWRFSAMLSGGSGPSVLQASGVRGGSDVLLRLVLTNTPGTIIPPGWEPELGASETSGDSLVLIRTLRSGG